MSTQNIHISQRWPQVKAISFDLDDTLWPIGPVIGRAEQDLFRWLQQNFPQLSARHSVQSMRKHREQVALQHPELAHDVSGLRRKALEQLLLEHGVETELALAQAKLGWQVFYARRNEVTWYPDARPMLDRLQQRYRLVATTNGNADLAAIGAQQYFELAVRAGEIGHAKPAAAIWQHVSSMLALQAHEILHIGDHPEHDALGAGHNGYEVIWLSRERKPWLLQFPAPVTIQSLHQLQP
ncbi:MAG: HAD-IA family hydrolase [Gammaproteobacteria bacterium]|jgi:HAD superfamily hydrolase (TIGR01549 family)|nr:HAD-IA family hydrolase [Gammaproteobacteria bacterium]